jgi:hypothetical protein
VSGPGIGNRGGGIVSQSPMKDKAFSLFLDQNAPFESRPKNGISLSTKACPAQSPVIDNSVIKRLGETKISSDAPSSVKGLALLSA